MPGFFLFLRLRMTSEAVGRMLEAGVDTGFRGSEPW